MHKPFALSWLVTVAFIFSACLNVVHAYEHDDHDEHEQHSEECEICLLLSGLSDHLVGDSNTGLDLHLAEENYIFVVKDSVSAAIRFTNSRAPPHIHSLI